MRVEFPHDVRHGQRQAARLALVLIIVLLLLLLGAAGLCGLAPAKLYVSIDASPVDDRIVFVGRSGRGTDLFIAHLDTGAVRQVTNTEALESDPAFSPDGQKIVFSRGGDGREGAQLWIQDLGNGAEHQVTPVGTLDRKPCWSKELGLIAFARATQGKVASYDAWLWTDYELCTIRPNGSGPRQLTHEHHYDLYGLAATRDGRVVYSASDAAGHRFLQVGIDQPGPARSFPSVANGQALDLSPTTSSFAAILRRSRRDEVWYLDADSGYCRQLSWTDSYKYGCRWTRDGKRILFLSGTDTPELWSIDADGSDARRLANRSLFDDPLHWTPGNP